MRRISVVFLTAAVTVGVCARPADALSTDDILLYAPMDGTTDATIAAGNPKAHVLVKPRFGPGKIGQAFLSGMDGSRLAYPADKNTDVHAGTVAMWIKPLNWSAGDRSMRFWFRVGEKADAGGKGSGSFIWLYKYLNSVPLYWLVQQDYRQRTVACVGTHDAYRPGQWGHIAASWCGPVMRLYVNGKHVGTGRAVTPTLLRNFGAHVMVGGGSWTTEGGKPKEPDTAIDEVYVFRRPLASAELQALCTNGREAIGTTPANPELEILAACFPSTDQLRVRVMVNGRRPGETKGLEIRVRIARPDGTAVPVPVPARCDVPDVDGTQAINVRTLRPGAYRLTVDLLADGRSVSQAAAQFDRPGRPEWLGNRLGIPTTVPKPWTPIVRRGETLACWGRTVTYRDSLWPVQMTSQGRRLLTRPIRITAKQNGRALLARGVTFRWGEVTPLRAVFTAQARLGTVPLKVEGSMAFDGFVWTTLNVPAQPGAALDELKLEIPLRPEIATLQHGWLAKREPPNGKVTAWHLPILGQPFLWLGNEDVGLQWCTGDDYCWENAQRDRQMELKPGAKEVLLVATLVDHRVPLDRAMRFTFGLHPTPVRPLPTDWRTYDVRINAGWHEAAERGEPSVPKWPLWFQKWNLQNEATKKARHLFGYPVPGPGTRELITEANTGGSWPFIYGAWHQVWRGAPAYRAFRSEWHPENPEPLPTAIAGSKGGNVWRTVPSWHDWMIWRYHKTFSENPWLVKGIAGVYNDVVQPFWGVEPRPDRHGMMRTCHEILGMRQVQKRLYVMMQNNWPKLRIVNHQSSDTHLAQLGFAHMYVTGETYRGHAVLGKEQGYYHVMDLDSCRAELLSPRWGVTVVFLPETASSGVPARKVYNPAGIPSSEHLMGLLLVHDVIVWPALESPIPIMRVAALKEAFGWDEKTEFTGYWKTAKLVHLEADQSPVVASVYRRPGKLMFVVMNNSDSKATVTLQPIWSALGVSAPKQLVDAYSATGIGEREVDFTFLNKGKLRFKGPAKPFPTIRVAVEAGRVRFPVAKRNFRVLVTP